MKLTKFWWVSPNLMNFTNFGEIHQNHSIHLKSIEFGVGIHALFSPGAGKCISTLFVLFRTCAGSHDFHQKSCFQWFLLVRIMKICSFPAQSWKCCCSTRFWASKMMTFGKIWVTPSQNAYLAFLAKIALFREFWPFPPEMVKYSKNSKMMENDLQNL